MSTSVKNSRQRYKHSGEKVTTKTNSSGMPLRNTSNVGHNRTSFCAQKVG